ncbi:hypothetical protein FBY33_0114 [Arthrobacter sp. SLBN-112]|nr:hypothetical protein [Arthrobacter sp. SLBN-112]TQJ38122.1 hypothetical protein FBY33_0114 [Arthrobacter sp. SLBN-112]
MMYWDGNMGVWGYILMGVSVVLFGGAVISEYTARFTVLRRARGA